jgi:hypothetical protein
MYLDSIVQKPTLKCNINELALTEHQSHQPPQCLPDSAKHEK